MFLLINIVAVIKSIYEAVYAFLVHFKSKFKFKLQLEFASKLVFELPYRVANVELLAVEVEDAYCMQ